MKSRGDLMINDLSNILRNLSDSSSYNKAPPVGPPIEYPTLSTEELEKIQESVFGRALGNEYAYDRLRLIEDPEIIDVEPLITEEIDGLNLWSIDGVTKL